MSDQPDSVGVQDGSRDASQLELAKEEMTKEFILSEYQRLVTFHEFREEHARSNLQFHLTVLTGGIGLLAVLYDPGSANPLPPHLILAVLGTVLLVGIFNFAGILSYDLFLYDAESRREAMQRAFSVLDEDQRRLLARPFIFLSVRRPSEYRMWSSYRGILQRGLSYAGPKALIGISNSVIAGVLCGLLLWVVAQPLLLCVTFGSFGFAVALALHMFLARLRYRWGKPWVHFEHKPD